MLRDYFRRNGNRVTRRVLERVVEHCRSVQDVHDVVDG